MSSAVIASPVPTIDLIATEEASTHHSNSLLTIDRACRHHGFFLLENHGMEDEVESMWRLSKQFFDQAKTEKHKLMRNQEQPLGYYDRELTKRKRDLKEVFDFMQPRNESDAFNQWPENNAEFKQTMLSFFDAATVVAERTLSLVFRALNPEYQGALPKGDVKTSNVRLNCYPKVDPLNTQESDQVAPLGNMALHHHTDPGILTLLLQDSVGGLQALSTEDGWIDVPPKQGTIVVNLGDAMQVWSNDRYRSAVHRVKPTIGPSRYSTPYFYSPSRDATLAPITALTNEAARYRPFTWREYIQGRIDDNYADLGEDDIQISRFKVG